MQVHIIHRWNLIAPYGDCVSVVVAVHTNKVTADKEAERLEKEVNIGSRSYHEVTTMEVVVD